MSNVHKEHRFTFIGNHFAAQHGWNKKLCFEARDTLCECADAQENGNKFRCPDELYAYEMWCPNDFRRVHSFKKRRDDLEAATYDKAWVDRINSEKALVLKGKHIRTGI